MPDKAPPHGNDTYGVTLGSFEALGVASALQLQQSQLTIPKSVRRIKADTLLWASPHPKERVRVFVYSIDSWVSVF